MKELTSIKQKRFADNLINAGFTRNEVAQALQMEFQITSRHATVLVYRWYVGTEYKVSREAKKERSMRLPFSKKIIKQVQKDAMSGIFSDIESVNDQN